MLSRSHPVTLQCIASLVADGLLGGCSHGDNPIARLIQNPAAACASDQTAQGLAKVALDELLTSAPEAKGTTVVIKTAVLDSFDQTTKKASCTADLALSYPSNLKELAGNAALDVNPASYTVQPTADGKSIVYTLQPQTAAGLQVIAARVIQAKREAGQPKAPPEVPGADDGTSVAPTTTSPASASGANTEATNSGEATDPTATAPQSPAPQ